jgi:hypothetical protein
MCPSPIAYAWRASSKSSCRPAGGPSPGSGALSRPGTPHAPSCSTKASSVSG